MRHALEDRLAMTKRDRKMESVALAHRSKQQLGIWVIVIRSGAQAKGL